MRVPLLVIALAAILAACAQPSIETVGPERFAQIAGDKDVFVLDVHTPEQEHLAGTDAFIAYDKLRENAHLLPEKDVPVAIYCRSGSMSAEAAKTLQEMGYRTVYELEGGALAWKEQGLAMQGGSFGSFGSRSESMTVYKSQSCGCCGVWSDHMDSRFDVGVVNSPDVGTIKRDLGVPAQLESCHTATIDGYFVEGHIPKEAVERLLEERPDIKGIAMPGMPSGSPGMPGAKSGPFVIYAVGHDGSVTEYMRV